MHAPEYLSKPAASMRGEGIVRRGKAAEYLVAQRRNYSMSITIVYVSHETDTVQDI